MHTLHTLHPLLPFLLLTTPATSTPALPLALTATLLITTHTTQLYTCPSPWTYFCFRSGTPPAATSSCECYAMTPATATCPTGTRKYCSDYITTECSCSYPKQPDCPPMFDFECVPAPPEMRKEATWVCTCSGRVYGERACPRGFASRCGPGGSGGEGRGCRCRRSRGYLSMYTPRPGKGGKAKDMVDMGETEVEDVEDMVELVEVEGDENWEYELK
ncbi:uncharacterized protein LAJ45_01502 [Morchella importuna]|uniref:uncharacterized protein n=1 Tax=Morchella importuna TaxID=1174673 RepID=UPI001E8D2FE6|nr:uncharacterized protein LAJ45_01502 [Morchella importuna]KAH8154969.1 hypothetical protein LAJ45_01502 [Morchella importuna]